MFSVTIQTDVERAQKFIKGVADYAQTATGRAGKEAMARILERAHKNAFDNGGWQFLGGGAWEPTHPKWVERMQKPNNRPLYWTGRGRESIKGRATADGAALSANEYLGKFQFGPFSFFEVYPIDSGGHKLPDSSGAVGQRAHWITVQEREVFRLDPEMVTWWEDEMLEASGLGAVAR